MLTSFENLIHCQVYDQTFYWGGKGGRWGGGSSEICLKWGGRGEGSLRDISKNILKTGDG